MRVLGIDYGRKRIGLALSDATGMLARPWMTIGRHGAVSAVAADLAQRIAALRQDSDGLAAIVIGLPRRLSGEANEMTAPVRELATALGGLVADLPVILQDERLSSHEAEALLAVREKDWRRRKALLDAAAAAVILQDYLDTRPTTPRVE